jgi:hypothetical protein
MRFVVPLLLPPSLALGGTELENDGFTPGDRAFFQGGFVEDEYAAVTIVPPGPIDLCGVRFLFGGSANTATVGVYVWRDDGSAWPGAVLHAEGYAVHGSDEELIEVNLRSRPIAIDGPIRIGLLHFHRGLPSVARDSDGITPSRNWIFTGGGWHPAEDLGVQGDWIIRAVAGPCDCDVDAGLPDAGSPDDGARSPDVSSADPPIDLCGGDCPAGCGCHAADRASSAWALAIAIAFRARRSTQRA